MHDNVILCIERKTNYYIYFYLFFYLYELKDRDGSAGMRGVREGKEVQF